MIVGAGFMGNFIIDELRNDHYREGRPVIALDDNPAKYKKRINGVKIVGICDDLPRLTEKYKIDEIIFCIPSAAPARRRDLVNLAMGTKANVKISPSVQEFWENGNGAQRIRNVEISDLLSRPEVTLDKKNLPLPDRQNNFGHRRRWLHRVRDLYAGSPVQPGQDRDL